MGISSSSISTQRLNEFFLERLNDEQVYSSPPLTDNTLSYLVNLLVYFSNSRNFFISTEDGLELPTLAFLYRDANHSTTTSSRLLTLRRLGDSALLIGSIFPEKLARAGINKDYYIGMGGAAYSTLADYRYGDPDVFEELSARFPRLLQVVAKVCSRQFDFNAEEIFALYKQWESSGDDLIKRQLMSLGITTFDTHKH